MNLKNKKKQINIYKIKIIFFPGMIWTRNPLVTRPQYMYVKPDFYTNPKLCWGWEAGITMFPNTKLLNDTKSVWVRNGVREITSYTLVQIQLNMNIGSHEWSCILDKSEGYLFKLIFTSPEPKACLRPRLVMMD